MHSVFQAFESSNIGFGTPSVVLHNNQFMMFYVVHGSLIGIAKSDDGVHWWKPQDIHRASWTNQDYIIHEKVKHQLPNVSNIIGKFGKEFTVTKEGDIFLAAYECPVFLLPERWADICAASSIDGIHWKQIRGVHGLHGTHPPASEKQHAIAPGSCDSNIMLRPTENGYLLTTRYEFPLGSQAHGFRWRGVRGNTLHDTLVCC